MLTDLDLPSLEERRRQQRLTFLYKVVKGHVPAINIEHYLRAQRPKRTIRAKQFEDFVKKNIVERSICNNTQCFRPITAKSDTEGVDRGYPIPSSLPLSPQFPPPSPPLPSPFSPTSLPLLPHFPPPIRFFPPPDKILFLFKN